MIDSDAVSSSMQGVFGKEMDEEDEENEEREGREQR